MNSLTYLSHQFDVFASAKTPPSTPTSDHPSFIDDRRTSRSYKHAGSDTPLQRVKTWSTRSFLFPPSSSSHTSLPPKRSFSSPADFFTLASLQRPLVSPASSTLSSSLDTRPAANLEAVIRRIFFIRILVLAWDTLCAAWTSVAGVGSVESRYKVALKIDAASGEKEIHENETANENRESPLQPTPPSQSPITSPPSVQSPFFPLTNGSHTDSTPPFETKPEPQSLSLHASSSSTLGPNIIVQAADQSVGTSRSPTPILNARKTPFHLPKTLVLDLDETLIHSTSRPIFSSGNGGPGLLGLGTFGRRNKGAGHTVEVVLGGRSTLYHVYKRPFVDFFLRTVSGWYTLVIFTASMQEYADPVIDWLDAGRGILARRLFRDSCTQLPNGSYTKDLAIVEQDLSRICLVDNSPISYRVNEENGIPIEGWTHDPSDEALLDLLPVLDSLRFTSDVRRVLGLRSAGGYL